MLGKRYKLKTGLVFLFFLSVMVFMAYRLFTIQVLGYTRYSDKAKNKHQIEIQLQPKRGDICDRNGNILAMSVPMPSVYADPMCVKDVDGAVLNLSQILKLDKKELREKLTKDKRFVWIKRKISTEEKEKIVALKIQGIEFQEEPMRFYPKRKIASHMLGFVNIDNDGMEGVELYFNKYLKGAPGLRVTEKDARGREVLPWRDKETPPVDGYKLVLTIDEVIQYIVEEELDKAMGTYHPIAAMAIIMDPNTGEILALSNRPNYDPNDFRNVNKDALRNRVITDCFEPGSVFKMYSAGAALNEKLFRLTDNIFCENGSYAVPGGTLHDSSPHGMLTFEEVVEKSSNIGIAKIVQKLGAEKLYRYLTDFGFGQPTGVMFPGEASGMLHPVKRWIPMSITRIPMGHEVAVTAMQLAAATSAIANGGELLKPLIVKRVIDNKNRTVEEFSAQPVRRVMAKDATDKLKKALEGVLESGGTATRAKLAEYTAAGKTGTAQKLNPDGTYSHENFMSSFIGFVPANKPRVLIGVILDSPRPVYYGGVTAAPVFKNIAEKVLGYLNVVPDVKEEQKKENPGENKSAAE